MRPKEILRRPRVEDKDSDDEPLVNGKGKDKGADRKATMNEDFANIAKEAVKLAMQEMKQGQPGSASDADVRMEADGDEQQKTLREEARQMAEKEHREKLRQQQEADPRASDAGWDTLGQYWDNLSRRTDRLALRTPSYPGIKSQSIPWKDNSRPPTRIREKAVPGGAQNQMSKHAFKHVQPDSDPWQHPGASSPFAKVKDQINQGEASPQTQSPARSPATSPLKTKSPLRQGRGPTQEQTAEDRTKLGL